MSGRLPVAPRRPRAAGPATWRAVPFDAATITKAGFELLSFPRLPYVRHVPDPDRNLAWDGVTWRPSEWWTRYAKATTGGAVLGTNAPKLYQLEEVGGDTRLANVGSIESSLAGGGGGVNGLGVRFVRQPGPVDLFWDDSMSVPVDAASIEAEIGGVYNRSSYLPTLLSWGASAGSPLVLTFLHLGLQVGWASDPMSGSRDADGFVPEQIALLNWDDGHVGNTLGADVLSALGAGLPTLDDAHPVTSSRPGPSFSRIATGPVAFADRYTNSTEVRYGLAALDTRSEYHLRYVQHIAYASASFLEAAIGGDDSLRAGLEGIELFNEVNAANVYVNSKGVTDPGRSGELWAHALVRAVLGFVTWYEEHPSSTLPALWWPSLASPRDAQDTDYLVAFHAALVARATQLLASHGVDPATVLVNQDVHFYRFRTDQGVRPIAELYRLLERLAQNFTDAGLSGITLSVCETGASADDGDAEYPGYASVLVEQKEYFQAREVIRRAAVAIAAGASRVGWNSHFGDVTNFSGCGLRWDTTQTDGRTALTVAAQAHTRLSYWAWQYLGSQLNGATGLLLWPDAGRGDELLALDTGSIEEMVVVVELSVGGEYLYVALVDSTFEGDADTTVEVGFTDPSLGTVMVSVLDPIPSARSYGPDGATDDELPASDTAEWAEESITIEGSATWELALDMNPLILRSPTRLDVSVAGTAAPPPSWRSRLRPPRGRV